jgi:membrane fusion protein (multidrug efflux system)
MKYGTRQQWLGLAAAISLLPLAGCSSGKADATNDPSSAAEASVRVINVEVTPVVHTRFTGFIRITGEVEALNDVTISAEETGRITSFLARKGQWVGSGDPIAKLEDDFLSAQVEEARAAAQLAREEWLRQRQLWEEDSVGTELMYLQRKYQADIAAARLSQLESRLARTVIRSPVAGVFDDNYLEVGEMALPGQAVARVVSTNRVKITAGVPERYARSVHLGDSTLVTFDIFPDREFVGRVNFVGSSVDESNRTFPIEILLDNPEGIMKPAMVANVRVEREQLENAISIPQQVVLRSANGYKVFVVENEGGVEVAKARDVTLGPASSNNVVIERGLNVGDLLITLGQQLVDQDSRVRVVNSNELSSSEGMD